jgi:DNA-binding NtrC family response regulator
LLMTNRWSASANALREAGFDVVEAANADDAMAVLKQDNFTTVLTDMPGAMNGLDLAWAVQGHNPRLPVVLVSGRKLPHPNRDATHRTVPGEAVQD